MRTYVITILLAQALFLSCLYGQDWKFKTGEEDWGETVYASQSNANGATITIFTGKEAFKPAMLISPYKSSYGDSFTVDVTVDKKATHRLRGSSSDYFGEISVDGIGNGLLEEMKQGGGISISIAGKDTITFSLSGCTKALGQFDGSSQKDKDVPQDSPQSIDKHPIEAEMESAIDENPSTAGMSHAFSDARDEWEKEIVKSFVTLKGIMEPEEFEALRLSQHAWELYRDAEVKTQGEIFSRQEGTMWVPVSAATEMGLYQTRAMLLDEYVNAVSERGE